MNLASQFYTYGLHFHTEIFLIMSRFLFIFYNFFASFVFAFILFIHVCICKKNK